MNVHQSIPEWAPGEIVQLTSRKILEGTLDEIPEGILVVASEGISTGTSGNMIALISRWTSNGIAKLHAGTIIRKTFKAISVGKLQLQFVQ